MCLPVCSKSGATACIPPSCWLNTWVCTCLRPHLSFNASDLCLCVCVCLYVSVCFCIPGYAQGHLPNSFFHSLSNIIVRFGVCTYSFACGLQILHVHLLWCIHWGSCPTCFTKLFQDVSHGVWTHAQLPAVDLKSTLLTTRADSHAWSACMFSCSGRGRGFATCLW